MVERVRIKETGRKGKIWQRAGVVLVVLLDGEDDTSFFHENEVEIL